MHKIMHIYAKDYVYIYIYMFAKIMCIYTFTYA